MLIDITDTECTMHVVPMHCHITHNIVTSVTNLNTNNSPNRVHWLVLYVTYLTCGDSVLQ